MAAASSLPLAFPPLPEINLSGHLRQRPATINNSAWPWPPGGLCIPAPTFVGRGGGPGEVMHPFGCSEDAECAGPPWDAGTRWRMMNPIPAPPCCGGPPEAAVWLLRWGGTHRYPWLNPSVQGGGKRPFKGGYHPKINRGAGVSRHSEEDAGRMGRGTKRGVAARKRHSVTP